MFYDFPWLLSADGTPLLPSPPLSLSNFYISWTGYWFPKFKTYWEINFSEAVIEINDSCLASSLASVPSQCSFIWEIVEESDYGYREREISDLDLPRYSFFFHVYI